MKHKGKLKSKDRVKDADEYEINSKDNSQDRQKSIRAEKKS